MRYVRYVFVLFLYYSRWAPAVGHKISMPFLFVFPCCFGAELLSGILAPAGSQSTCKMPVCLPQGASWKDGLADAKDPTLEQILEVARSNLLKMPGQTLVDAWNALFKAHAVCKQCVARFQTKELRFDKASSALSEATPLLRLGRLTIVEAMVLSGGTPDKGLQKVTGATASVQVETGVFFSTSS